MEQVWRVETTEDDQVTVEEPRITMTTDEALELSAELTEAAVKVAQAA
jgi:hypothetical protein